MKRKTKTIIIIILIAAAIAAAGIIWFVMNQKKGEAKHTLRLIKDYNLSFPVFFDSEEPGTESVAQACALKYMEIIKAAGYAVGIYASESWYKSYMSGIKDCPLWIAKYGINDGQPHTKPSIGGMWGWQYTSTGKVNGVPKAVDMNIG